jgi:16S rRNA (guanine527-N7)-methyltransferase
MFHVKHEGRPPVLDRVQQGRLAAFEKLLRERAVPGGMIAIEDLPRIRERHVEDALRAAAVVEPTDRDGYDLGSGAGLPGVVVAIACPWLGMTLIERRRSRAAFLEMAIEELGLENAVVAATGTETMTARVDVAFARAFAPPDVAWAAAVALLRPAGRLVYFAGERFDPDTDVPVGVAATLMPPPLARSGPLVIMARQ